MSIEPSDPRTRVVLAGHRGDREAARTGLDHDDPRVRVAALGALARCGALTVDDLDRAAHDHAVAVRRRAAEEAGRWRAGREATDPRPVLATLLGDADHSVVEMAAWGLGEHPGRAADVTALSSVAVDHDESLCREAAVAALGALGDPEGLPAILTATGDRATVRRRAVLALAPFNGAEVDTALTAALDDRDWQVRQAAEDLTTDRSP